MLTHAIQYQEREAIIDDLSLVIGPVPEFCAKTNKSGINHLHWTRGAAVAFFKTLPEMPAVVQNSALRLMYLTPQKGNSVLQALRVSSTKVVLVLALGSLALEASYIIVWRWLWKRNIRGAA